MEDSDKTVLNSYAANGDQIHKGHNGQNLCETGHLVRNQRCDGTTQGEEWPRGGRVARVFTSGQLTHCGTVIGPRIRLEDSDEDPVR